MKKRQKYSRHTQEDIAMLLKKHTAKEIQRKIYPEYTVSQIFYMAIKGRKFLGLDNKYKRNKPRKDIGGHHNMSNRLQDISIPDLEAITGFRVRKTRAKKSNIVQLASWVFLGASAVFLLSVFFM